MMKLLHVAILSIFGVVCISSLNVEAVPESKFSVEDYNSQDDEDLSYEEELSYYNDLAEDELLDEAEIDEDGEEEEPDEETSMQDGSAREGRRNRFRKNQRRPCTARSNNTTLGICLGRRGCVNNGGSISGRCGPRGSVCCLMEKQCSQSTNQNNTMFVNYGYPDPDSGTGACSLTINRYNDNICQMRFDFVTLELSQPDADGNCVTDFLTVTGGTSASPIICGTNTDQHMYVDVDPEGGAVRLTVDRTAASMADRMWKVRVSQIECTSKFRAPAGCLQYFTETSGTISSFNFDQEIDEASIPQATRQIVNMNYAVCIKTADGYCSIMWTRNITGGDYGFTVSSNIAGLSRNLVGDPASSSNSGVCETDHVIIPGSIDDLGMQNDRFCGAGFPNHVITSLRPFVMYVTTDSNEQDDVLNRGFRLDYRQMIC